MSRIGFNGDGPKETPEQNTKPEMKKNIDAKPIQDIPKNKDDKAVERPKTLKENPDKKIPKQEINQEGKVSQKKEVPKNKENATLKQANVKETSSQNSKVRGEIPKTQTRRDDVKVKSEQAKKDALDTNKEKTYGSKPSEKKVASVENKKQDTEAAIKKQGVKPDIDQRNTEKKQTNISDKKTETIGEKPKRENVRNQEGEKHNSNGMKTREGNEKNLDKKNQKVETKGEKPDSRGENLNKNEKKLAKEVNSIEKTYKEANEDKTSVKEKRELYSDKFEKQLYKTTNNLENQKKEYDSKIKQLEGTDKPEDKQKIDELKEKRKECGEQIEKMKEISKDVANTKHSEKLDEQYQSMAEVYNKAKESSSEDKKTLFTPDYESATNKVKENLESELKDIESEMAKFDAKTMKMEDYPEWKKLNNEKTKREEQISDLKMMAAEAKEFERSTAMEESQSRLWTVRGESKGDKKKDLEKDQECVRYNLAVSRGLREDCLEANQEKDAVDKKLSDLVNTYTPDELQGNKHYEELLQKYGELSDKIESYEHQLKALENYNERLAEINGKDKNGEWNLDVKSFDLKVTEKDVTDNITSIKESSLTILNNEKIEPKDCVKALAALEKADREVIPALAEQVSDLQAQISKTESYIKNNPWDTSMQKHKEELQKELAPKLAQYTDLVENTTYLKTNLQVDNSKHSVKCLINADGTYTLQQRWTNVKEKVTDSDLYKNTRQFYSNAYDRVSNCNFDSKGNTISKDFSFKYKLMGYYSERKIGNEKINLHNIFETGLLNVNAKGGWDSKEGFNFEGNANVFEIKDSATLNALNKQMLQWNSNFSVMEAKGKVEFEQGDFKASFSANDGWSASTDLSIGKVQILNAAASSWSNGIEGKTNLAEMVEGKFGKAETFTGDKQSFTFGDKISMYEYSNSNGEVEHKAFVTDVAGLFNMETGFSDIKEVYDGYSEQKENIDDIKENGILKDEVQNDENVAFQSKQPSDRVKDNEVSTQDAKDFGERLLNGSASGELPTWIKESDVIKAMDKSLLSLDDQKLVKESANKIQKGEAISKGDAVQLEYIHMELAANDYGTEAKAVSHLYEKKDIAIRNDEGRVFKGAEVDKEKSSIVLRQGDVATQKQSEAQLTKLDTIGGMEPNDVFNAMKKSFLATDDVNSLNEMLQKSKNGEKFSEKDLEQIDYIVECLKDNGFVDESRSVLLFSQISNLESPFTVIEGASKQYEWDDEEKWRPNSFQVEDKIQKISDIQKWLKDINPKFDPFDAKSPYCNNCGSCAYAVEQRFNGNSDIVASSKNIGTVEAMNKITSMEQNAMTPQEIHDYLVSQGPGAHGIVGVDRKEGPGHWFNAYYDGEKVVAIDGQDGSIRDWPPNYGNVVYWDFSVKK